MNYKEQERIAALKEYQVLDTAAEADLDALAKLASTICQTPIALISLIDENRQWFKANKGLNAEETPRNISFCQHAIKGEDVYEVENATVNPIFARNPLVTGYPNIRFYAGAPLSTPSGYNIGTLCVIDTEPKILTDKQKESLRTLSKFVISQFELRKTKRQLEENKAYYENLVEKASDTIYTSNIKGEFTFVSKSIRKLAGYNNTELLGKHFTELVADEYREIVARFYMDQIKDGREESLLEFPIITSKGKKKWIEQTVTILFKDGKLIGYHGIVRDIDHRKRVEQELITATREAEEIRKTFQGVLNNTDMVVAIKDIYFRYILVNKKFEKLYHITNNEIYLKTDHDIRPKELADALRITDIQVVTEKRIIHFEQQLKTSEGQVTFEVSKFPLYNDNGDLYAFCLTATDITERKKTEAAVKERDQKFSAMFHSSPVAMTLDSIEPNRFVETNESFSKLTGFTQEELLGLNFTETGMIDAKQREKMVTLFKERGYIRNEELKIIDKNKLQKYILLSVEVIEINGKPHTLGVYHNITERKILERQLVAAKDQAEESGKAKEQFLANMSHEIRTPMNAVLGFTDLLSETTLSPEQKEYVHAIETSGKSLMSVINDILDYSKIEAGMLTIEEVPLSIRSIFSSLFISFNEQASKKYIKLSFESDSKIPEVVTGDPARLTQIITNLVGNAIKFTQKGEITVNALLLEETKDKVIVQYTVKDSGIGIPEDKIASIFERFNQGSNDTTRKYGGTGLGLSIVKKLAELQGGSIAVKSIPQKESTFVVIIPYGIAAEEAKESMVQTAKTIQLKSKTISILLAEDNRLNQKLAEKILQDFGFRIDIADNGKIAIDKIKQGGYDVVLMDMQMPEMNGYEATQVIRQQLKINIPIIAMTAHAMASERERCLQLGMNDYISKPFKKDELYEKIIDAVEEAGKVTNGDIKADKVPTLNLAYIKKLAVGNDAFVREILQIFTEDTPLELERLNSAIKQKDYEVIKDTAHRMKSSLKLVGLEKIAPHFSKLEALAAENGNISDIAKLVDEVSTVFIPAFKEASELLKKND